MFLILCLCFYWFLKAVSGKKKNTVNPYIDLHQKKMDDDKLYADYIEFCKKNGELPMEKSGYQELRMKEEKQREKINNAFK
ncbi:hypothetical protein [Chryseobacterium culicis]|uniref:hypothetical protein n=1 Tax=Chryseobacterium culicis TaxID=680127 RepID=UPI001876CE46|nr:hypothetical protein [Chryseobacterium culicis]MBE4949903.1 hypothetical protein [Chryseobacterium culicis]